MRKLVMICGLLFGMIGFAQAQQPAGRNAGGQGGRMNPEARVKQLDEKLKLSDEQKTKLTALFTEQADAQKKMREEAKDGDREMMRERMKAFREENDKKLNGILTADQQKAYKTIQDEQRAAMQKRAQERQKKDN